jgi:uncharacterized protein (DUF58 family)
VLTARGWFALAAGAGAYVAARAFGSEMLYPVAVGLVLAAAVAFLWVRLGGRPTQARRTVLGGRHVAGDDVPVQLDLVLGSRLRLSGLSVEEQIHGLGVRHVALAGKGRDVAGRYVLERVPRGRYQITSTTALVEDPFSLGRRELAIDIPGALVVYPRIVELETLFSESSSRVQEGKRLLVRRPSGFDLHSVREHQQGESLRRVHWPSTAKRSQLMVKDLEDAPRDEALVLLDADANAVAGTPPETSFELAVSAAGSVLHAHLARGRRAALVINGAETRYEPVQTIEGDWERMLELLAAVQPDGRNSVAALLAEGAGAVARALEVCVVTSALTPRLSERLLQRSATRRGSSLVFVDPAAFVSGAAMAGLPSLEARAQIARLEHGGISVSVLRPGDDLATRLGAGAGWSEAAGG